MKVQKLQDFSNQEKLAKQLVNICESSFFNDAPWTQQQFLDHFKSPFAFYLIASKDDEILGFLNGQLLFEEFEIFLVAVLPAYKKQGIGTFLLENLGVEIQKTDVEQILLEVRESNDQARGFYKKHGFECYYVRQEYYQNPVESAQMLRKEVRSKKNE